jgi:hypothetical protein
LLWQPAWCPLAKHFQSIIKNAHWFTLGRVFFGPHTAKKKV